MKSKLTIRRCKNCNERFQQVRTLQYVCGGVCASEYQKKLQANKMQKEWRDKKKVMKENLLSHKDYIQLFQITFNTFIRMRDVNKGCISCGAKLDRKFDAGHYYSAGHYPALRFDENNVHGQCVSCNQWLHGNLIMYAERLPERIGQERFDILTKSRENILKLKIPEIKEKIIYYKSKIKELKS